MSPANPWTAACDVCQAAIPVGRAILLSIPDVGDFVFCSVACVRTAPVVCPPLRREGGAE